MTAPILAKDIMATKLITLPPNIDVFDAIGLLLKHRISGAPVVEPHDGHFVGMFSEKDCMQVIVKAAYEQIPTSEVFAYVSTNVHTVNEETDLLTIAQIFRDNSFRRVPVVRDGKLVGQISRRDVLQAVHKLMAVAPANGSPLLYLSSLVDRTEAPIA